ncbi:MAG: radical SAM protein [Candidatus Altiarchaeota archaeon]
MEKKLTLLLSYNCNNNCRFCYCADKKGKIADMTTERSKRELRLGRERGCTFVDFNGGEPTLRKDLPELISYAKKLGYRIIALTTNGRMFSYENFAKKMIDSGLNHIIFSLHGYNADLHDFLTQSKGSFKQAINGMKNVREVKPDIHICTNTTITKYNYKFLPKIAESNIKLGANSCEFIFVHPRGNALKNFDEIVPMLTELQPYISRTIEIGKKYKMKHFHFRYLPVCFILGYEEYLSELQALKSLREQHVGPEFQDLEVEKGRKFSGRVKGPQCKICSKEKICEGIFREYAERRGFDELNPVK